ncbi:MAG TPA: hypothetical protein VGN43_15385, partial [Steroidobacteraceae bacterium]|nr:hypothetical protein [Steroidobacteraceae bacterium]
MIGRHEDVGHDDGLADLLDLVTSAPTVVYEVARTDGSLVYVDNPAKLPPVNEIDEIREPII